MLQNIQRVQFAPVEELPLAVAEVDPLAAPDTDALEEPTLTELASPVAATALADLYRQQELEVPILVPRDGPIAALDPDKTGLLAQVAPSTATVVKTEVAPGHRGAGGADRGGGQRRRARGADARIRR